MNIITRNNVQIFGDEGPVLLYAHGFGCNETPRGKPRSISRTEELGTSTPERVEDTPKGERGKPRGIVPVRNKKEKKRIRCLTSSLR